MNSQKSLMDRMLIDCEKVSNMIVDFIRKKVAVEKKNGVVLGLSGGVTIFLLWYKIPFPSVGIFVIFLCPLILSFVILRYHLFEIRVIK